jgi:uncharacterized membrane protein
VTAPTQHSDRLGTTFALGALGGALLAHRGRRRIGPLAALIGVGLIGYAARPLLRAWVVRRGAARRRVRLRTMIEVARPVPEVFAFCKDFENFARVIGSIRRITDFQDGRSHWEAYSPSGDVVEWDVVVTKYVPNAVIGWSSVPSSGVRTMGIIRFAASPSGSTRLTIELTLLPNDNGFAEALRALAARPRQKQLLAEIERASFYIESLPPREATDDEHRARVASV